MLIIPKIAPISLTQAKTSIQTLLAQSVMLEIATENWPGTGAVTTGGELLPRVTANLAHDGSGLLVFFRVRENGVRAVAAQSNEPVYQDSCVEIFIKPEAAPVGYYNFEFNCVGTCLNFFGSDRNQRTPNSPETIASIFRESSLGSKAFGSRPGVIDWSLLVRIPVGAFTHHRITSTNGLNLTMNLY